LGAAILIWPCKTQPQNPKTPSVWKYIWIIKKINKKTKAPPKLQLLEKRRKPKKYERGECKALRI
jgi:hypothetical protein